MSSHRFIFVRNPAVWFHTLSSLHLNCSINYTPSGMVFGRSNRTSTDDIRELNRLKQNQKVICIHSITSSPRIILKSSSSYQPKDVHCCLLDIGVSHGPPNRLVLCHSHPSRIRPTYRHWVFRFVNVTRDLFCPRAPRPATTKRTSDSTNIHK